jgi:hypothetical protein
MSSRLVERCPERGDGPFHCWHHYDPKEPRPYLGPNRRYVDDRCCWCGKTHNSISERPDIAPMDHGPYLTHERPSAA